MLQNELLLGVPGHTVVSDFEAGVLSEWIGKTETRQDVIGAHPAAGLSALLDHTGARALQGEVLPPAWHWLYFLDTVPASELSTDGHPRRGGFMPPVQLARRMWAGSRLRFHAPLKVGDEARRASTVTDIQHKQGRSGELVLLTLRHEIYVADTLCIEEEQDIVYRGEGGKGAVSAARTSRSPFAAQWSKEITPDPTLLFRFSALTFNSHRIHYDREYAMGVEGYESLVVQGPLTATLLLDLMHRELPGVELETFDFRAVAPLVEGSALYLHGAQEDREVRLWALNASGVLAMQASAQLR